MKMTLSSRKVLVSYKILIKVLTACLAPVLCGVRGLCALCKVLWSSPRAVSQSLGEGRPKAYTGHMRGRDGL